MKARAQSSSAFWSACAERPSTLWIAARTGMSSAKMRTRSAPSIRRRPSVPCAWRPGNKMLHSRRGKLWRRWCRIRPASHMPLAEIMMAPDRIRFSAMDSSALAVKSRYGRFSPRVPSGQPLRLFVEQFEMFTRDACGLGGHRRIDKHHWTLQTPFAGETVQVVEHLLGSADRKGRHDDVAATLEQGFLDDADHVRFGRRKILVPAVAVGGLDDEDVGVLDGCRVAQDGASRLAQIAAEHDL